MGVTHVYAASAVIFGLFLCAAAIIAGVFVCRYVLLVTNAIFDRAELAQRHQTHRHNAMEDTITAIVEDREGVEHTGPSGTFKDSASATEGHK